jgi:hypothetical protein
MRSVFPRCQDATLLLIDPFGTMSENAGPSGTADLAETGQMAIEEWSRHYCFGTLPERMATMALPQWMRTSVDAISLAQRLRRTDRQDLIDAVERGDTTLEAAVEQAEREQASRPA